MSVHTTDFLAVQAVDCGVDARVRSNQLKLHPELVLVLALVIGSYINAGWLLLG